MKRGFTLIELLVVIGIIGVLATFAVVQLAGSRQKARIAKGAAFSGQVLRSLGDDVVGRWDFDDCSGVAYDGSGNNRNITLPAGVTFSANTPQNQGCSLVFNGTTNINFASVNPTVTDITMSGWIYLPSVSQHGAISAVGTGYLDGMGFGVGGTNLLNDGNHFIVVFGNVGWYDTGVNIGTGWHFLAIERKSTKTSCYLDGSLVYSFTSGVLAPAASTYIGGLGGIGNGNLSSGVSIDEVRIFNRSLSAQKIDQMYAEGLAQHVAKR